MGITSNDIAAQRAMLERGEEKRKADWKQAERERLRDTFAAAALSGILTKDDAAKLEKMAPWWPEWACGAAYRWADAMLRERGNNSEKPSSSPTLTDAEQAAIEDAIKTVSEALDLMDGEDSSTTATLRWLLERMK